MAKNAVGMTLACWREETNMKVLAINSSARKDGNTALLIGVVFEKLTYVSGCFIK